MKTSQDSLLDLANLKLKNLKKEIQLDKIKHNESLKEATLLKRANKELRITVITLKNEIKCLNVQLLKLKVTIAKNSQN